MKYIYCLCIIALATLTSAGTAFSANEMFRSVSSGNWNSTSTWEMSTNGGGVWFAATSVPHDTSGATTVRSPNTVTVTVSTTSNQLTIEGGATLTINAAIVLTTPNGTGNEVTVAPSGIVNGVGTLRTQGAGAGINLRGGSAFSAQLNVNTGSADVYDQSSPFDGYLYGDLIIDAGATVNGGPVLGYSLTMLGNITNNGILTASSTGGELRIKGPSFVNNGTTPVAGHLHFDTTTSISGTGTFNAANQWINANGNVTLTSNVTFAPSTGLSINTGGDLNLNNFILTFISGQFAAYSSASVNAPGTFRTQNNVSIYPVNGSNFNADFHIDNGSTTGGNTGFGDVYYGNITIDNGASMNCGWSLNRITNFYGNIVNNGTLTTSSTGGVIRMRGPSIVNNGSLTVQGNFYFDSTTSISGPGAFVAANFYLQPNANVTLASNVTFSPGTLTLNPGPAKINCNGFTLTYTSGTFILNAGNYVNGPGTVLTKNSVGLYTGNSSFFNADLKINTGDCATGTTAVDRIFGNVTIDAGTSYNCGWSSGRRTDFYGNVTNNGTLTASSTNGTIRMKGPSFVNNGTTGLASGNFYFDTTTTFSGTGSFTSHFNLAGNAYLTQTSTHQILSVNRNAGTTFNITNQLLKANGSNPIHGSGTIITTGSTIEYNGTAGQQVSWLLTYGGLKINNATGTYLGGSFNVNDTINVLLGDIDLNGVNITLASTGHLKETPGNTIKGNSGYIVTSRNVNAPSTLNIGGLGVVLTSAANLGLTTIYRSHQVLLAPYMGNSITRNYNVMPSNNSGLNATFGFKYDESELGGGNENMIRLFQTTNSGVNWVSRGGAPNAAGNQVTLYNQNSVFGIWTATTNFANAIIGLGIQGFYNSSTNRLNQKDTVRAYLRNASAPYNIVDSAKNTIDSVLLAAQFSFQTIATGTYYIQIKHRNSIETWSKAGGESYETFTTLNYDFTTASSQAYGNNQASIDASPVRFGIYSGDVDQNGVVNLADVTLAYNGSQSFQTGYKNADLNGDNIVNLTDVTIGYNNSNLFIAKVTP